MRCLAVGLPGSVTPVLWGSLTASAVSGEEKQKGRCKDPSAEGERQFLKSKGGFLGGLRAAGRKSGLNDVVQGVRKWRPAVLVCLYPLGEGGGSPPLQLIASLIGKRCVSSRLLPSSV